MTTPECPKGPEREARPEGQISWDTYLYACQELDQARVSASTWKTRAEQAEPEVERLAAEVALYRERDGLTRKALQHDGDGPLQFAALIVRQQRDKALEEVSRLREQLAAQQPARHKVRITKLLGSGQSVAVCPGCREGMTGADQEAEDWKDQHEADTLRPQGDFGCVRADLVSRWKKGDKFLYKVQPDDEGDECQVVAVAGDTAIVEADPFPFGSPQRWSADVSELHPLPPREPSCEEVVPEGPEDASLCGQDVVPGSDRCTDHGGRPSGSGRLAPRQWGNWFFHACPEDVRWVRDCNGYVWRRLVNDQWVTGHRGDGPCGWPYLLKKFGPVTEASRESLTEAVPRVWQKGDKEPQDHPQVRDVHGDVWTWVPDVREWSSPETQNCAWSYMTRKWSPLTEVVPTGTEDAAQAARSEATHKVNTCSVCLTGDEHTPEDLAWHHASPEWEVGDRVHRPAWAWTGTVRSAVPASNRYRVQWDHMLDRPMSNGSSWCTAEELTAEVPSPSLPKEGEDSDPDA